MEAERDREVLPLDGGELVAEDPERVEELAHRYSVRGSRVVHGPRAPAAGRYERREPPGLAGRRG